MINIEIDNMSKENVWLMGRSDIENIYTDMSNMQRSGAPEYTVIKRERIQRFMSDNRIMSPEIDMFMKCPNPDLHVHYDAGTGRMIATLRLLDSHEIENLINKTDYPVGASVNIGFMEMIYMNDRGEVAEICVAPINMTCHAPVVYVGAIGFPNNCLINDLVSEYQFSHETLDISGTEYRSLVNHFRAWKRFMEQALIIWTGVQYALANPIILEMARTDSERINANPLQQNHRDKKFKTAGMKKIYIDGGLSRYDFIRNKYTGAWFVHGHWRTLPNGKKTWIDGYWKGPDRNNPDVKEEREVRIGGV